MDIIMKHFHEGGFMMYPILLLGLVILAIILERTYVLFIKANVDRDKFVETAQKNLLAGNIQSVIGLCDSKEAPLTKIVKNGLIKIINKGTQLDIQASIDEAALREIPLLEKRTGFLAMLGNSSTLLGLLGTITGLITSFAGVAAADPATKATMLANGISEAMNCTAFGLIVAIPALIAYAVLQEKTQKLINDINEVTVTMLNFISFHKDKFMAPNEQGKNVVGIK